MSVTTEPMAADSGKVLLDTREMAERLGWSESTLYRTSINERGFPVHRVGRKVQFNPTQVMEFLDQCARDGRVLNTKPEQPKRRRK